jgi:hypothetical protein
VPELQRSEENQGQGAADEKKDDSGISSGEYFSDNLQRRSASCL